MKYDMTNKRYLYSSSALAMGNVFRTQLGGTLSNTWSDVRRGRGRALATQLIRVQIRTTLICSRCHRFINMPRMKVHEKTLWPNSRAKSTSCATVPLPFAVLWLRQDMVEIFRLEPSKSKSWTEPEFLAQT